MFILLINYTRDVISESQRKGTAVLGNGQKFWGLLPEVVATGAGICDKAPTRGWGVSQSCHKECQEIHFFSEMS